jgi:hypothetical protein
MSLSLQEALKGVELRAGQTYRCQVNGFMVELHVTAIEPASALREEDIMLEPWVELPKPPPSGYVVSKLVPAKLPDPIDIPEEDYEA